MESHAFTCLNFEKAAKQYGKSGSESNAMFDKADEMEKKYARHWTLRGYKVRP